MGGGLKKHNVGLIDLVSYGVGAMIGAGIFVLSGSVAKVAGPAGIISFFISGLLALITAHSYVQFSREINSSGGGYSYISNNLPNLLAFIGGLWLFFAYVSAGVLYASSFGYFFGLMINMNWQFVALIIMLSLTSINALSFIGSVMLERIVVVLKVILLITFIIKGALKVNPLHYSDFMPNGLGGVFYSAALIFIAFEGFDVISTMSGEVYDQSKLPKAIYISIALVLTLYILINLVMTGILPYYLIPSGESGFISIASMTLGTLGFLFVSSSATISALGAFNATIYAASRVAYSMSTDGRLPKVFKKVNNKGVPYNSVMICGLLALVIFLSIVQMEDGIIMLGSLSSLSFMLSFALVNLSLSVKYFREKRTLMIWVPLIGVISCIILAFFINIFAWILLMIYTVVIYIVYFIYRTLEPGGGSPSTVTR